jgi:hypothetical protein
VEFQEASASRVTFEHLDVEATSRRRVNAKRSECVAEPVHTGEEIQHQGMSVLGGGARRECGSGARLRARRLGPSRRRL